MDIKAMTMPLKKPSRPFFSCGPTAKSLEWSLNELNDFAAGRSHRSSIAINKFEELFKLTKEILEVPQGFELVMIGGSNSASFEAALWNLLSLNNSKVNILSWDYFGREWLHDIINELKITDAKIYDFPFGKKLKLDNLDFSRDTIFTWCGTSTGVAVNNLNWIDTKRTGLVFCDATSNIFTYDIPFEKVDVLTWSWQKGLGSEAGIGMLLLSPKALERLEKINDNAPIPRFMRLKHDNKIAYNLFKGEPLNTISLLSLEDCLFALRNLKAKGGLKFSQNRVQDNSNVIAEFLKESEYFDYFAPENFRSKIAITLKFKKSLSLEKQKLIRSKIIQILEKKQVAFDIGSHAKAHIGLRIWCGPTVETQDLQKLLPWLNWAYEEAIMHIQSV